MNATHTAHILDSTVTFINMISEDIVSTCAEQLENNTNWFHEVNHLILIQTSIGYLQKPPPHYLVGLNLNGAA